MRLVFMGSPAEVVSPLRQLIAMSESGTHTVVGVVSQPARPFGRKQILTDPPLASFAKQAGLPVWQPEKASDPNFLASLRHMAPDVIITAAYGQILSEEFLKIPTRATINIHPSMLPAYRGATPVPAALLDGCPSTGVSILFTVKALDAGNIILQQEFSIGEHETAGALTERLFHASGPLLEEALHKLSAPDFKGHAQDENRVTFCRKISKQDGCIDWQKQARRLFCEYKAYSPWPGIFTNLGSQRVLIEECRLADATPQSLAPGEFLFDKESKALLVGSSEGQLLISRLKPAGSKSLDAQAFWNGMKIAGTGQFT